jgi:hypothetical protein
LCIYVCFICAFAGSGDTDAPPVKVSRRASLDEEFQTYYNQLLTNVKQLAHLPTASEKLLEAPELSNDKTNLGKQLKEIDKNINYRKCSDTEYHAVYGYALAKLKFQYFTVCNICQSCNRDMFTVLSCKRCVKASNSNHKAFINDVKNLDLQVGYCSDYINFFISLAGLCTKFPNFKKIPWNSAKIKKFMPYWADQLELDKHVWADKE